MVGGNAFEDTREGSGFDRMMMRDNLVVFAILLRGHANVGALLSSHCVTEYAQCCDKLRPVNVAG